MLIWRYSYKVGKTAIFYQESLKEIKMVTALIHKTLSLLKTFNFFKKIQFKLLGKLLISLSLTHDCNFNLQHNLGRRVKQ